MSRKANIINYIATILLTMVSIVGILNIVAVNYNVEVQEVLLEFVCFAITAGLIHTIAHELGHLIFGKINGFKFSSMVIWFFKWQKLDKKTTFSFVMLGEEAGYTEMVPTKEDDIEKGFYAMTLGGLIGSAIITALGIPALFITTLPRWLFIFWIMLIPIGVYFVFGTLLPCSTDGVLNDGAVLYHFKKQTDNSKVMVNLLKIQANLFCGKTPSEIDESLYFDVPQLAEDNPNFALLLNARYAYYLDKKDYENAKLMTTRLLSLEEYLPKGYMCVFKTDALYNACTFDKNEQVADDLMYELEKYLNNINTATTVRVKLAYLMNINEQTEGLDMFIKKAKKEANRCQIKGLGLYEAKLLDDLISKLN